MKNKKVTLHIVKHKLTGAEVPVIIRHMSAENVIEDYVESLNGRKYFTIVMLQNRWQKSKNNIIEILQKFEVPGHINHELMKSSNPNDAADVAIFFEEYILAIEKILSLSHKKIKPHLYKKE